MTRPGPLHRLVRPLAGGIIRRSRVGALGLVVLMLLTAGCSQQAPDQDATPAEVMAAAKAALDTTSGVSLVLTSKNLPSDVNGVANARGAGNSSPAFKGSIGVVLNGQTFDVPVVALDGKVWAQIPLTTGWSDIDPADYNAPDPAKLLATDAGFSSLLTAASDVKEGETVRGGTDNKDLLTTYTGTLDEATMGSIIPTASGEFDAIFHIDDTEHVREMELTGVFYPGSAPMTYLVEFSAYDSAVQISAP